MRKFLVKLYSGKIMVHIGEDYELFGEKFDTCVIWRWQHHWWGKKKIKVATFYEITYVREDQNELIQKPKYLNSSGRNWFEEAEEV